MHINKSVHIMFCGYDLYGSLSWILSCYSVSFATVAGVLWLFLDSNVTPLAVMASLCQLRGPMAIERVKVRTILLIQLLTKLSYFLL